MSWFIVFVIMLQFPSLVKSSARLKEFWHFLMIYYISQIFFWNWNWIEIFQFFFFFQNTFQTKCWCGNKPTNRRRPSSSCVFWSAAAPQGLMGPLIGCCRPWIMQVCWREVQPLSLRASGHPPSPSSPLSSPSPASPPPPTPKFYFSYFFCF